MGKLSALSVKATNKPGRFGDSDGLYLHVSPAGTKSWVQRIVINDRRRDIGLGAYPAVSLAHARSLAADNRSAVAEGRDPLAEKREAKEAARNPPSSVPTFAEAAARVIELRRPTWSNPKHAAQWQSTLETYAFPVIANKAVDEITPSDILAVLEPIWTVKNETATRVKQRMGIVMDWAIAEGIRSDEHNPAGKHNLRVLPRVRKIKKHHLALPYAKVPAALERIRACSADWVTRLAFEFLVLTASRSGEVRFARWREVDRETATWHIPAERMKARREHRVPLAQRSLKILEQAALLGDGSDSSLIFPANREGNHLSDMAFTMMLRRLEISAVPHGFRRSFKSWATETRAGTWHEGEAALAHRIGNNETSDAYVDTDLLEPRRGVMEKWADFLQVEG